jgi:addiction module RelE/StbE family toxin
MFLPHSSFDKEYRMLSKKLQIKVDERLKIFEENPCNQILDNHPLQGKYLGCRSIDITGNYRAIYYMDGEIAIFIHIGTHNQLYG